jgi:hypothetical protein
LWYLKKELLLTEDNLSRRNCMGIKLVFSVVGSKISNISFLIVIMLNSCGV